MSEVAERLRRRSAADDRKIRAFLARRLDNGTDNLATAIDAVITAMSSAMPVFRRCAELSRRVWRVDLLHALLAESAFR